MKRKLIAIFALVVLLGSVVTMLEITATAQTATVPNVAGTWTGWQDTYNIEQYTNKLTVTQNGNQVQGTYVLTITHSIYSGNVGKTGAYKVSCTIDANRNLNFAGRLSYGPPNFAPTMSGTWKLSADGNTLSGTGSNYEVALIRGTAPRTFTITTTTITPTTNVPFTLSGTLKAGTTALEQQPVHLERRSYSSGAWGAWADVAGTSKYTDASGKVAVSQKLTTAGTYQYRWHLSGTATYSPALTETVKKPTALTTATPATAMVKTTFTVSGKLTTNGAGLGNQNVILFRFSPTANAWIKLATTKTSNIAGTVGTYKFSVKEGTAGTYGYQVLYLGTGTYRPASSALRWVDVA